MNSYLGYSETKLNENKGYWTAKEIMQQPECWRKTFNIVNECSAQLSDFMSQFIDKPDLRIILTGAGTSAFAGKAVAPTLTKLTNHRIEAIASTDLVSNPADYFAEDLPTLVVSFARSGNSPESVAAVDLADQCLSECYHLFLTCNAEGELYKSSLKSDKRFALAMPPESNDQSFAMTSSFTSMMLSLCIVFSEDCFNKKEIENICTSSEAWITAINPSLITMSDEYVERVIYLGSGGFQGLAQESSLKLLELTAGKIVSCFDSPLGFRHGPKSIVDDKTIVFVFVSNDPYTRKYDLDLLNELRQDNIAKRVIAISAQADDIPVDDNHSLVPDMSDASDVQLLFPYITFAQIYAFHSALKLGNTPDNPCPTGEVNRVVQGVNIHNFNK
ncbi:SIS domain-containing protein [Vibrio hangzhouensis]|uniref:Galactosamine 6-phosphate isomerase AgaS n=1 Tax=Vibrio hangzhouensis TaxID=462991 RepID=A0A1H6B856_9VIBR|nr:SIS domain-containing protein [Vibrio hangzhouensis]SEG57033.1 galactosamine 6-phosphate isomerase AgaS [Vibrio hangzhouensis]